ncbi:NUDIX domain-containing protein [Niallia sp. JL1B1071]|uniref:NUDIX domain-containing protein n=1 Tax=Niallia tiangongensis TaxID=3237105 RepID=UPI0037DC6162
MVLFTHYHIEESKQNSHISKDPFSKIVEPLFKPINNLFKGYNKELICFGHHHPVHFFQSKETTFLNPGSLGCNPQPIASYGIASKDKEKIKISLEKVAYDNSFFLESYETLKVPDRDLIIKIFHGNQNSKDRRGSQMYFNERIGLDIKEEHHKIRRRVAVRAVIMEKQKILLVQTNKGDFKFPGGGVERNEGLIEALSREVKEETGYTHCAVKECMGKVIENQVDQYDKQAYFQMISHYYMCELVKSEKGELELDAYESELEFTPVWVSVGL